MDHFTKSTEKFHIFAKIATYRPNFCVPSLFHPRKVANVFGTVWKWGMFFVQGHGKNCHMSNGISGMVQGNIEFFNHFQFLTLGGFILDFLLGILSTTLLAIIDGV